MSSSYYFPFLIGHTAICSRTIFLYRNRLPVELSKWKIQVSIIFTWGELRMPNGSLRRVEDSLKVNLPLSTTSGFSSHCLNLKNLKRTAPG
ncbi:hypothetical protein R6Q59_030112 [Mikania micrantha]